MVALEKKYSKLLLCLIAISIPTMSFILKGNLKYHEVLLGACIVCLGNVIQIWYTTFHSYVTVNEKTKTLRWNGVIGAFVRVACCLIIYAFDLGLVAYLFCYSLDILSRFIYIYVASLRLRKQIESAE